MWPQDPYVAQHSRNVGRHGPHKYLTERIEHVQFVIFRCFLEGCYKSITQYLKNMWSGLHWLPCCSLHVSWVWRHNRICWLQYRLEQRQNIYHIFTGRVIGAYCHSHPPQHDPSNRQIDLPKFFSFQRSHPNATFVCACSRKDWVLLLYSALLVDTGCGHSLLPQTWRLLKSCVQEAWT